MENEDPASPSAEAPAAASLPSFRQEKEREQEKVDPVRLVVKHTFLELETNTDQDPWDLNISRPRRQSDSGILYGSSHEEGLEDEWDLGVIDAGVRDYAAQHPNSPMRIRPGKKAMAASPESADESGSVSPKRLPHRKRDPKARKHSSGSEVSIFQEEPSFREGKRASDVSVLSTMTDDSLYFGDAAEERFPPSHHASSSSGTTVRPPGLHRPAGQGGSAAPQCPPYPPFPSSMQQQLGYCDPWWGQPDQPYGAAPAWPPGFNMGQQQQFHNVAQHPARAIASATDMAVARNAVARRRRGDNNAPYPAQAAPGAGALNMGAQLGDMSAMPAARGGEALRSTLPPGGPYAASNGNGLAAGANTDTNMVAIGEQTTVMMRNLPESYSRNMLVGLLDRHGLQAKYDFVYMPMNFRNKASFGYAFVNFVMPIDAQNCHIEFQGFTSWEVVSNKVCDVSWSNMHQGLAAHIERYRNSPVMHESVPDEYKPAVYKQGQRAVFPGPTKKLRVPRIRRPNSDDVADGDDGLDDNE